MTSVEENVEQNKRKAEDEVEEIDAKKLKVSPEKTNGDSQNGCKTQDEESSSVDKDIIRQIEYYFGDINLPRDKFMLEQVKLDDGWIPMSTMLKFQRLVKLSSDGKVVAKALSKSQLMEVDESGEEIKIRRSPEHPLPEINEERRKEITARTIYCKGFPTDSVIDDMIKYFADYGPVENIIMRKYKEVLTKTYKFKGSVFVTFNNKEKAKEFLDIEDLKHGDKVLIKMWQVEYAEQKKNEMLEWKNKKAKKGTAAAKEEEVSVEQFARGATLHLKGEFKDVTREIIKGRFASQGFEPAFITYSKGDEEAYVRLHEADSGKKFLEKVGKEMKLKDSTVEMSVLEGEEEETYLKKAKEDKDAYLKKCQASRFGGKRGRGGRGQYKGRKNDGGRTKKGSPGGGGDE